jgi:hypothetical protein
MFVIVHEEFVLWKHHEVSSSSKMFSRMDMVTQLVGLAQAWEGLPWLFPALCLAAGGVLGRYMIPWSSDGMADELAGLVGRKMGRRYRTLAVNAGTNFPELLLMGYALLIGHWGGIANPFGQHLFGPSDRPTVDCSHGAVWWIWKVEVRIQIGHKACDCRRHPVCPCQGCDEVVGVQCRGSIAGVKCGNESGALCGRIFWILDLGASGSASKPRGL